MSETNIPELRAKELAQWQARKSMVEAMDVLPDDPADLADVLFTERSPLCAQLGCDRCPVALATGAAHCRRTPFYGIRDGGYHNKEELIALIERMISIIRGEIFPRSRNYWRD